MQEIQLRTEMLIQLANKDLLPKKEGIIDADESIIIVDKLVDFIIKGRSGKLKII